MSCRALLTVFPGVLALAVAGACAHSGSESAPGEAGSVTDVSGAVTALRGVQGSPARTLSRGDVVFSDDTITTEPGATVTIALSHNGAHWTLGGDTARRVDRSAAWRAPRGSDEATFVTGDPDRTASAGRHTEAVPEIERAEADEAPAVETAEDDMRAAPPAAATPPPPPIPDPEPAPDRTLRKKKSPPKDDKKQGPVDDLFVGDDEFEGIAQKLTRAEITTAFAKVVPAAQKCGEQHGAKPGVVVSVKLLIAKDGSVSGAVPMKDHAKTALGRCVAGAVKAARFRENNGPPSVIYPFRM